MNIKAKMDSGAVDLGAGWANGKAKRREGGAEVVVREADCARRIKEAGGHAATH